MTTALQLVEQGVITSLEAARKRITRAGFTYSQNSPLSQEQLALFTEKKVRIRKIGSRISETVTSDPRQQQQENNYDLLPAAKPGQNKVAFNALSLINYADMALYAVGLFLLLGFSGLIVALMVVSFYYETVSKIKAYSKAEQDFGIFILGSISILGAGLHYVTYCLLIEGLEKLPTSPETMAFILAFATSGIAFSALYQKVISSTTANS